MIDFFGRKRKKREAAEKARIEFEATQYGRLPAVGHKPIRDALVSDGPQRRPLEIRVDDLQQPVKGFKPSVPVGSPGWHGRIVKQGRQIPIKPEGLRVDRPYLKVFYRNGHLEARLDRTYLKEAVRACVVNPKLLVQRLRMRAAIKLYEEQRLYDMALFR